MKIVTQNVCPPIPTRNFDWQAYDANTYDGPGSPLGEGPTEQAAIADLQEQLEEREPIRASSVPEGEFDRPKTTDALLDLAFLGHAILVAACGHISMADDAFDVLLATRKELSAIQGWLIGGKWAGGNDMRVPHDGGVR